ncbi:adenylosuccinate lyase [Candidatus Micrarchaeota archaeon]|nr:adenylosuccinate lyase [Candidatus Micrarchaeota archaeon]
MVISPFEDRYKTEINALFDEEAKLQKWMIVEVALAKVHAQLGNIPKDAPKKIENGATKVKVERVHQIENEIHHDLMAMVKALSEQSGDAGKYVHLGATSYDIEDTATALIFVEAIGMVQKSMEKLGATIKKLAIQNKNLVCVGRTHGQHAVPTTYGLKFAIYYQELKRNMERLGEAKKRVAVGKMSGAVGTMATFGTGGPKIQKMIMKELGLEESKASNQVIQRDRHAEVLCDLGLIAAMLEKIAKEIRNLQRTEIAEVYESFGAKQVGSSTMPQKRNPHKSERVCSLARLVRANVLTAMENIALEHERDLTNSANERAIFAESFISVDYMLVEMTKILGGLNFFHENIKRNLELTNGLIMSERLMIYLVENKKMGRQEAHELVRTMAQEAFSGKKHLKALVIDKKLLSKKEADELFDYSTYTGCAKEIVENAVKD